MSSSLTLGPSPAPSSPRRLASVVSHPLLSPNKSSLLQRGLDAKCTCLRGTFWSDCQTSCDQVGVITPARQGPVQEGSGQRLSWVTVSDNDPVPSTLSGTEGRGCQQMVSAVVIVSKFSA